MVKRIRAVTLLQSRHAELVSASITPRAPSEPAGHGLAARPRNLAGPAIRPELRACGETDPENKFRVTRRNYSGRLSCFFHGFSSRLLRSFLSPNAIRRRVECG